MSRDSEPANHRTEQVLRGLRRTTVLNTLLIFIVGTLVVAPEDYRIYIVPVGLSLCLFYLLLSFYIRE